MERPLLVEIIAYAPTAFYHCTHCEVVWREADVSQPVHQEQVASSLPDDLVQQFQEISNWAAELFQDYQNHIELQVIDAASPEGLFKSLKYGAHHYPAVIVNHKARFNWAALGDAKAEISRCLGLTRLSNPQKGGD